jgi:calcineurin-like phosphoesterase family protein
MFHKKFNKSDLVYFAGCCHLQHKNITRGVTSWGENAKTRPYNTTEEMTEAVIKSLQTVPPEAHLFILGDFLFGDKDNINHLLGLVACQNLYYIYGNHCKWMRNKVFNKFKFVGDYLKVFYGNQLICMSHYPFAVWNESHHGSWMIHSHSHGSYNPGLPNVGSHGKILDVGWDVFNRPVEAQEIKTIMDNKEKVFNDGHNERTNR